MDVPADKRVGPQLEPRSTVASQGVGSAGDRSARGAKRKPHRLAGKGGAKSLWGSGEERGPRPSATRTIGPIRQGSPAAIQKISTVSFRQRGSELPQDSRDGRVIGVHRHLDSFQDPSPCGEALPSYG
jgi:hypothetical protein